MHIDKLAIEELRLLVLLYKTHSLKDSAVRLNVSTPTASRMLARLRAAVEDELFIRSASAMTPTHACRRLFPRVERILAEMDALTHEPQVFRPSHIKRIFRVMLPRTALSRALCRCLSRSAAACTRREHCY
ncbi:LysR family transcriptional regulator [Sutterella wadsworthensis]|uniref:LysR family transcriptional regulator n=1 Tax=Sutterella wadsworthensis TaxID=40545 RepID=UPI00307D9C86